MLPSHTASPDPW